MRTPSDVSTHAQSFWKKPGLARRLLKELLSWCLWFAAAMALAFVIKAYLAEPIRVDGHSMEPTLMDQEIVLATKPAYLAGSLNRFDVVICKFPERGDTLFVKRLVGLPGDSVAVFNRTLYVNGEPVDEPYIAYPPSYSMQSVTLGENEYFVLGDNRAASNDSHLVGTLTRDMILGRVRCVLWPLSGVRVVE